MIHFQIKHYNELTLNEFHDLIALRIKVFIIEQNCPYQDLDGKDKKSYHLIGRDGYGNIVATARILPHHISYPEISIGRVVIAEENRGNGSGHDMMKFIITFIQEEFGMEENITISAQKYLEKFYETHGFKSTGKAYLEDDIPHVQMKFSI
jgi:ElaA protein